MDSLLHAWRGSPAAGEDTEAMVAYFEEANENLTAWQRELFGVVAKRHAALASRGAPLEKWKTSTLFDVLNTTVRCPPGTTMSYIGAALGMDGGKWVCGMDTLVSPCAVFSLGSDGDYKFEESVLGMTPCTVHTFDCTIPQSKIQKLNARHFFHSTCIGSAEKAATDPLFKTLPQAIQAAGVGRVDVLKIDIEGFEYDVLATWGTRGESGGTLDRSYLPTQVLMEVHLADLYYGTPFFMKNDLSNLMWPAAPHVTLPELALFFVHLADLGYAIANQEKNPAAAHCSEFVLVKVR